MKTIIIGTEDPKGLGTPTIICGPEIEESKKFSLMETAKRRHEFPKGFQFLQQCTFEPIETAIFISEDVAKDVKNSDDLFKKRAAEKRAAEDAKSLLTANLKAGEKLLRDVVIRRNQAIGEVARIKGRIKDSVDGGRTSTVKQSQKELDSAQPIADKLIEEYNVIFPAVQALRNAKSTPEQIEKALVDLKLKEAAPTPAA